MIRFVTAATFFVALFVGLAFTGSAGAQGTRGPTRVTSPPAALALATALEKRLTVWRTRRGEVVHVSHCRRTRSGCRRRIATFARWMAEVGQSLRLDSFLLAAVAVRESGLDPFARGGIGERGLIQLHPRGVGRRVKFVQSERYRRYCRRKAGACQREVLAAGAKLLAAAIARCGSVEEGLGAYNTGKCLTNNYARRILKERQKLRRLARASRKRSRRAKHGS